MADTEPWKVRAAAIAGLAVGAVWRALPGLIPVGLLAWGASWAWPPGGPLTAGGLLLADQIASRWPHRGRPR
jgi:hypothetical protein